MKGQTLRAILGPAMLLAVAGCGPNVTPRPTTAPVSGTVKYQGKAVEGATVSFMAAGSPRVASGVTNADGAFQLTTFDTNDGAVAGEHSVTIVKADPKASGKPTTELSPTDLTQMTPAAVQTESQIPAKYQNAETSGLKRTVVEGEENVFNFELTD
jgi:hypothetical protein